MYSRCPQPMCTRMHCAGEPVKPVMEWSGFPRGFASLTELRRQQGDGICPPSATPFREVLSAGAASAPFPTPCAAPFAFGLIAAGRALLRCRSDCRRYVAVIVEESAGGQCTFLPSPGDRRRDHRKLPVGRQARDLLDVGRLRTRHGGLFL